jgi:hypothetical protein
MDRIKVRRPALVADGSGFGAQKVRSKSALGGAMHWTKEDGEDVGEAIVKARAVVACLEGDLAAKRARWQTRRALDAVMQALLALDDVYFEDENGGPVPAAWKRARELLRKG